jgi:16S rRNA (guanine966-N2)-methyltransferase
MTRIISGFAGSTALKTPGGGTRPTSDRVREAIFSALESRNAIDGARVLDLYAGSGALGLEAASRGASFVRLVERGGVGTTVCRSNAAAVLAQAPRGSLLRIEVSGRLELAEAELAGNLASLASRLEPDAVLCLERSSRSPEPIWPPGIQLDRRKDYGDTTLWWASAVAPAE